MQLEAASARSPTLHATWGKVCALYMHQVVISHRVRIRPAVRFLFGEHKLQHPLGFSPGWYVTPVRAVCRHVKSPDLLQWYQVYCFRRHLFNWSTFKIKLLLLKKARSQQGLKTTLFPFASTLRNCKIPIS